MNKFQFATFLMPVFVIVLFHQGRAGITADELASQVERRYRSLSDISMDFTKITRSEVFENPSLVQGKMLLKNPDKFRIETKDEIIVCDGKYVWDYSVENEQVVKSSVDKSESTFQPNQYLSDFRTDYIPSLTGEEKIDKIPCFKLLLSSKQEDALIKKMTIWVDKQSYIARKIDYRDSQDNDIVLEFKHVKVDRKIKDTEFVFQAPPGVEEVDLTE
ncbi:MAG TPA: outer membrane lipoprotein carrier protein LolA [candidate division Zixibacteria bacterium]